MNSTMDRATVVAGESGLHLVTKVEYLMLKFT